MTATLTAQARTLTRSRMGQIDTAFVTKIYRSMLRGRGVRKLADEITDAAHVFAQDDMAGRGWSEAHGYSGYTSYASLNDLSWRAPEFAELETHLDTHVAAFAKELDFDLGGSKLALDSLWINVLEPGGTHAGHIHPHSVISGTYYAAVPPGSGAIRFEDPRHAMMMAAPPRRARARAENRSFIEIVPKAGMVILWESWLRHDVRPNLSQDERVSISFNYALADKA